MFLTVSEYYIVISFFQHKVADETTMIFGKFSKFSRARARTNPKNNSTHKLNIVSHTDHAKGGGGGAPPTSRYQIAETRREVMDFGSQVQAHAHVHSQVQCAFFKSVPVAQINVVI